jgi:hypothetical protein
MQEFISRESSMALRRPVQCDAPTAGKEKEF